MQAYPRLVIGAPQGRSGKTTTSLGICAALAARGLHVQPFKKGPDYIDPSWLSEAAGQHCRSLDAFFCSSPDALVASFLHGALSADISVIEGNHGLFDSTEPNGAGSTAEVARTLQAPVVLVVNCARIGRSVAALVAGYLHFEPETHIVGVILNNVAHPRHETRLREALAAHNNVAVLGAIPTRHALTIPERHLGLAPRSEEEALVPVVAEARRLVEEHVDLDLLQSLARSAPLLPRFEAVHPVLTSSARPRIGVIRDRAFSFYYPENLEALEAAGAELVFVEALEAAALPRINLLYVGGGFPELFLTELAANEQFRLDVLAKIEAGLPVYAECGGLMYLARSIQWQGASGAMVSALPIDINLTARPQSHGYVAGTITAANPFFPMGARFRGHEFHHSRLSAPLKETSTCYSLTRGVGIGSGVDGLVYRNVLASYTHLHVAGAPFWAEGLVNRARAHARGD